jgi:hypothetical protein
MKKEGGTNLINRQGIEHTISIKNSILKDAINRLVCSRPKKIDFGHIQPKLFSLYFTLMRILFILYN